MQEFWEKIITLSDLHWQEGNYRWVFYLGILLVLCFEKQKTTKTLLGWLPIAFLICIYNPLFWEALEIAGVGRDSAYFARMFSFMPIMYTIALGFTSLIKKTKGWIKCLLVFAICIVLCVTGKNIFKQDWYVKASNYAKVSQETYEVASALEGAKDENGVVRVATIDPVTNYMRQVTDYVTPYARYLGTLGWMLSSDPPDVVQIMKMAGEQDIDYVIAHKTEATLEAFERNGYQPYALTTNMAIFKVTNVVRSHRVLNEIRQVVSITRYDENGNAIPTEKGYTTVEYEYDKNGYCSKEKYLDENGNPFLMDYGYTYVSRTCSDRGLVKSYSYHDAEGNLVMVAGKLVTKNEYNIKGKLIREFYYDENGEAMLRIDGQYASREFVYNDKGIEIGTRYFDKDGKLCINSSGYAEFRYELDEKNRVKKISYFNTMGQLCNNLNGYAEVLREYNDNSLLVKETYLDEEEKPVVCKKGYYGFIRQYDDMNNLVSEEYIY